MQVFRLHVAPYVGAWIETDSYDTFDESTDVAPYVGAWIETFRTCSERTRDWSHPTWVRGLKHTYILTYVRTYKSHPTWVRGLKLSYQLA